MLSCSTSLERASTHASRDLGDGFPDPAAAFSNFRRMLKPTGRLAFVCWRSLEENELTSCPFGGGPRHLLDPTPFSFETTLRARHFGEAGFKDIRISAHDQAVTSGDLDA